MSVTTVPKKGYKSVPWLFGKEIEIPEEWELKKIKDIAKVSVGLVINPSTYFDKNGTIPMITGKNVTEKGIVLDDIDLITEESNEFLESTRIWDGDLVTMRVGYPGRTCLVKKEHDGINCASVIITRKNKTYQSQFFHYLTNSKLTTQQITKYTAGGARQVVNINSWKEFLITYPPLPEQQQIASILSNVDNLIQNTDKLIEKTTRLKKGLMQKLLTRGIGHAKFKKVKWYFGKEIEIPQEWEVVKFRSMIKMEYGTGLTEEKRDNFGNPVYGSGGLIGLHSKPIVNGPGIIVARKGSLGNVFLENNDFFPIDTVYYITEKQTEIDLKFLFYYLLFMKLENLRIVTSKPGISREDVYSYRILSIPFEEQQKIASILSNTDEKIQSYEQYKEKLQRLKKSLIQKLLTGEVRVAV